LSARGKSHAAPQVTSTVVANCAGTVLADVGMCGRLCQDKLKLLKMKEYRADPSRRQNSHIFNNLAPNRSS
jgi:hypothetical protein